MSNTNSPILKCKMVAQCHYDILSLSLSVRHERRLGAEPTAGALAWSSSTFRSGHTSQWNVIIIQKFQARLWMEANRAAQYQWLHKPLDSVVHPYTEHIHSDQVARSMCMLLCLYVCLQVVGGARDSLRDRKGLGQVFLVLVSFSPKEPHCVRL